MGDPLLRELFSAIESSDVVPPNMNWGLYFRNATVTRFLSLVFRALFKFPPVLEAGFPRRVSIKFIALRCFFSEL